MSMIHCENNIEKANLVDLLSDLRKLMLLDLLSYLRKLMLQEINAPKLSQSFCFQFFNLENQSNIWIANFKYQESGAIL